MWILMLMTLPRAQATWGPYDLGFMVTAREDAPTDARLLYGVNYGIEPVAAPGEGAPQALETEYLGGTSKHPGVYAILPPGGAWSADTEWEVEVLGYAWYTPETEPKRLSFRTGSDVAPDPVAPTVEGTEVGAWRGEGMYQWGCCLPTRSVTFSVVSNSDDPWSYLELAGEFADSSSSGPRDVLVIQPGLGAQTLQFEQWNDEHHGLQPHVFVVTHVASDGARSTSERFEFGEDGEGVVASGCRQGEGGASLIGMFGLLGLRSLRRRR